RPSAVALHFARHDQLTVGLPPTRMRPCWAHNRNTSRLGGWYSQFIQDTEWKDGSQSSFRV
ncbi:hypothetical protein, partial [Neorhizobium sp. S3-V5DH]|uniref:hypothetical protein n=1 Tax=Neorhizobium sp. S3-V5DH TaxID=2485166 RepID=UPI001A9CB9B3